MNPKQNRSFLVWIKISALLSAILLSGCARTSEPVSKTGFYLDTVVTITLYDTGSRTSYDSC
ncbi:MAG: hypothetical protein K2K07_03155, partial [Lachnospiraceae bacterium]|nr:hypothetical protein [Lachnospiraceae bacterium]